MGTTLVPHMALPQLLAANPHITNVHLNEPGPHREIAIVMRPTYFSINGIHLLRNLFESELVSYFTLHNTKKSETMKFI